MLDIHQLCCIRDRRVLFDDLSFSVRPGELVQIEGANGAGKTSLLRIMAGLGFADSGNVLWNGEKIKSSADEFYQKLLFLGHQIGVKRELTAFENLAFYQKMHDKYDEEKLWHALASAGLAGYEDIPAAQLSAGQNRRIALARLWISHASLWILDEPLTAIDRQGVVVLERLFQEHANNNGMVVFTTHQTMFSNNKQLRKIRLGE